MDLEFIIRRLYFSAAFILLHSWVYNNVWISFLKNMACLQNFHQQETHENGTVIILVNNSCIIKLAKNHQKL